MLQPVENLNNGNCIVFRNIQPNSVGEGLCYVRDGEHRITKDERPFIKLYLQDVEGVVIPGYVFDIADFKSAGLELTKVTSSLIRVQYEENYIPRYGMSLRITKIELLESPPIQLLQKFVGTLDEAQRCFQTLTEGLSQQLGTGVNLPYVICTKHHADYNNGAVGGLVVHYWRMFEMLKSHSSMMSSEEKHTLFGTFFVFIYSHMNFLSSSESDSADINLLAQLTATVTQYSKQLQLGQESLETIHMFFGYEPKDFYVRLIREVSNSLVRASKEYNMWKSLPTTREGNAGYGTIKRYV